MLKFSEYVSLGHPDKIADYISQYILDRYIERDPATRYAVEVQIKDKYVTLGGEVASAAHFDRVEIASFVREAVNDIGYTKEYQDRWGKENTICGDDLLVTSYINEQSPDIAQGLPGWGDQGIFFGMYLPNGYTSGMPFDHHMAKVLCKALFDSGIGGLDIKTQVVLKDKQIKKIIVAIPLLDETAAEKVREIVEQRLPHTAEGDFDLIVNGTGRYVRHSSIADCGTTGRKLAVDFYGGNCMIGGGSPWTKDATKADLTLNLMARKLAIRYGVKHGCPVYVKLACSIGSKEVDIYATDNNGVVIQNGTLQLDPEKLRVDLGLDKPIYASMCRWGLFGRFQRNREWEKFK